MIRHVVMWKFNKHNKEDNMQMFKDMLLSLDGKIDEIKSISVGKDINDSKWDMALVVDFDSIDALNAYKVNPKHQKVSEFCKRIRIDRCAVDFKI